MVEIINFFFNIFSLLNFKELRKRFISSVYLFLLIILLVFLGNPIVSIFFSLIFSLLFIEYEGLIGSLEKNIKILKIFILQGIIFLFTIFEIYEFKFFSLDIDNFIFFISFSILINFFFLIFFHTSLIEIILSYLIIISFFCLISILQRSDGLNLFLYIVILVSTMDIFAFFGGKLFGNRKIIPKISKGKTIEGSLIGLFSTILMSYFIRELVDFNINYALICGLIISILAFVGDLVESLFKRKMGVKDSGKLIPGHGGLLDRFDGYLLVIPFIYFFII